MKCEVTSNTTHDLLISKEISYKSYKEICSGEPKKVNLGFWGNDQWFNVENNTLVHIPRSLGDNVYGKSSEMTYSWEVLSKFFLNQNIEPNWLNCDSVYGWYDPDTGTYIQHSHWSSSYITALSLVESSRVVKYFHALKGPTIGALSDATPAILCHKEPARRKNTPY